MFPRLIPGIHSADFGASPNWEGLPTAEETKRMQYTILNIPSTIVEILLILAFNVFLFLRQSLTLSYTLPKPLSNPILPLFQATGAPFPNASEFGRSASKDVALATSTE